MPTIKELFDKIELFSKEESEFVIRIDNKYFLDLYDVDKKCFYYYPFIISKFRKNDEVKSITNIAFDKWESNVSQQLADHEKNHVLIFKDFAKILKYTKEDVFNEMVRCMEYSQNNILFFSELGFDREKWIDLMIWKNKQQNELHPFISNEIKPNQLGYKIINYLIRNWFLPRYDFDSIRKLKAQIQTKESWISKLLKKVGNKLKPDRDLVTLQKIKTKLTILIKKLDDKFNLGKLLRYLQKNKSMFTIIINSLLSIIPTLMVLWGNKIILEIIDFTKFPLAFNRGSFIFHLKEKEQIIRCVYNTPEVFFEGLFIILIGIYLYKSKKNPLNRYLISPRLLIGILLGYLAVLGGSSYWSMAILSFASNNIFTIILANILLLLIVFLYIRYEVRKSIGDSDSQEVDVNKQNLKSKINFFFSSRINIRSFNFFRKAVWSSFFIGLLIIDTFFIVYLRNIESAFGTEGFKMLSHRFHTGLIGIIDPVLLLFFFPLALISGVVIKFILDEKPITQPIK